MGSGGCNYDKEFDSSQSITYQSLLDGFTVSVNFIQYAIGGVKGNLSEDIFSIGSGDAYRIKRQLFVLSNKSTLSGYFKCGLFSLGLNNDQYNASVVYNLYLNELISIPSFSLFLNDIGYNGDKNNEIHSNIIFGSYDLSKYSLNPSSNFTFHSIPAKMSVWSIVATNLFYGNIKINLPSAALILEPGFSPIAIPEAYLLQIFKKASQRLSCTKNESFLICPCEGIEKLPDLIFQSDNQNYSIPSKYYIKEEKNKCVLMLVPSNQSNCILGQIFLRQYYSYYDMKNKQIGLVESIYYKSKSRKKDSKKISDEWLITILCVTTCIILGASLTLCWVYVRHKRPRKHSILSNDSQFSLE